MYTYIIHYIVYSLYDIKTFKTAAVAVYNRL